MKERRVIIGLLVVLTIVAIGSWFMRNFEWREQEIEIGYLGEARTNPYLAAGRFLRRMGVATQAYPSHQWSRGLPPADAVFVVTATRTLLTDQRLQSLLDWADAGGHLIVPAWAGGNPFDREADRLMELLEINRLILDSQERKAAERSLPVVLVEGDSADVVVFSGRQRLASDAGYDLLAEDDTGGCVLHVAYGQGAITVLCNANPFRNDHIGELNHARFLWRLVQLHRGIQTVWWAFDSDMPPLLVWLFRHLPELMISLLLLAGLFVWRRMPRFGPLLDQPPPIRRSLLEHIDAGGRFLWRNRNRGTLVEAARRAVELRAARKHPGWHDLPEVVRHEHLAMMSGLPLAAIERAFVEEVETDRKGFIRIIHLLESIRKRL